MASLLGFNATVPFTPWAHDPIFFEKTSKEITKSKKSLTWNKINKTKIKRMCHIFTFERDKSVICFKS
jgi:hypothetical protein